VRFGGRQKDCSEKHSKTGRSCEPIIPEAKGKDDQGGAGESEEDAEGHPGLGIAADAQEFWDQQDEGEQSADREVAQARDGSLVMRCGRGWGRTHLASFY